MVQELQPFEVYDRNVSTFKRYFKVEKITA